MTDFEKLMLKRLTNLSKFLYITSQSTPGCNFYALESPKNDRFLQRKYGCDSKAERNKIMSPHNDCASCFIGNKIEDTSLLGCIELWRKLPHSHKNLSVYSRYFEG